MREDVYLYPKLEKYRNDQVGYDYLAASNKRGFTFEEIVTFLAGKVYREAQHIQPNRQKIYKEKPLEGRDFYLTEMFPWAEIIYRDRNSTRPDMSTKEDVKPFLMSSDRYDVDRIFKRYEARQDNRPTGSEVDTQNQKPKGKKMPKKKPKNIKYYTKKSKGKSPRTLYYQEIGGVKKRISKEQYMSGVQKEVKQLEQKLKQYPITYQVQQISGYPDGNMRQLRRLVDQFSLEKSFATEQVKKELSKIIRIGRNPLNRKKLSKQDLQTIKDMKKAI